MSTIQIISQYVDLPGGVRLYTERVVSTQKPKATEPHTMVMVHGLGGSTSIYHPIYTSLLASAPSSTILAYDQSCHGLSSTPSSKLKGGSSPLNHDILRDELDALISIVAPKGSITLVGHSAGTNLVAHFLVSPCHNVSRVRDVILIAPPICTSDTPMVETMQKKILKDVEEHGMPGVVEQICLALTGATTREKRPLAAALMRCALLSQSSEGYAAHMRSSFDFRKNLTFPFEKMPSRAKVLIVGGDEDLFVPASEIMSLGQKIRNSKVFILPGVGQ